MAKVVIAGRSDCPYYSRVEHLADLVSLAVPSFQVHKITIPPGEWQSWLRQLCAKEGWNHTSSPVVWRELLDRGGKGLLIGSANDFQEYVKGYYDLDIAIASDSMLTIANENRNTRLELDAEEKYYRSLCTPTYVCITGAESRACCPIINAVCSGELLGPNTEIFLRLLSPSLTASEAVGLTMEVQDMCYGLLRGVQVVYTPEDAFQDCSLIVIMDELVKEEKKEEEEEKAEEGGEGKAGGEEESHTAFLLRHKQLFAAYGTAISNAVKHAQQQQQQQQQQQPRVVVAGKGPVNLSVYVLLKHAPGILPHNVVGVSGLVENRAKVVMAEKVNVCPAAVVDVVVWGDVNGHCFVDIGRACVYNHDGAIWGPPFYSKSVTDTVYDKQWLMKEYPELVAKRQGHVEGVLGHGAEASLGHTVVKVLDYWFNGSPPGRLFSLAVSSAGWYGVPEGLVFSFPVTMAPKGHWNVVQDIQIDKEMETKIRETVKDIAKDLEAIGYAIALPRDPPIVPDVIIEHSQSGDLRPPQETSIVVANGVTTVTETNGNAAVHEVANTTVTAEKNNTIDNDTTDLTVIAEENDYAELETPSVDIVQM